MNKTKINLCITIFCVFIIGCGQNATPSLPVQPATPQPPTTQPTAQPTVTPLQPDFTPQPSEPIFPTPIANPHIALPSKSLLPETFGANCTTGSALPTCVYSPNKVQLFLEYGNGPIPYDNYDHAKLWQYVWEEESIVSILAHDYLGGASFNSLQIGTQVYMIWGNGEVDSYHINQIDRWRDKYEWLVFAPWDGGTSLNDWEMYSKYYKGGSDHDRIVFQTCINFNQGILFVVGTKVEVYQ